MQSTAALNGQEYFSFQLGSVEFRNRHYGSRRLTLAIQKVFGPKIWTVAATFSVTREHKKNVGICAGKSTHVFFMPIPLALLARPAIFVQTIFRLFTQDSETRDKESDEVFV